MPALLDRLRLPGRRTRRYAEKGFVLVFAAVLFPVLLGLSGIAIDVGNWYLHIQRAQRAADAAALAGAIYLPGDLTKAVSTARTSLTANKVPAALVSSAEIKQTPGKPAELSVRVETRTSNNFLQLLGAPKSNSFKRKSSAVWNPGLGAGRYSNVLGNEPDDDIWEPSARRAKVGDYWLGIHGPYSNKEYGDRHNSEWCADKLRDAAFVDGCYGNSNEEATYGDDGYLKGHDFTIEVPKGATGNAIAVEVFDPATVHQGPKCEDVDLKTLYRVTGNPDYESGLTQKCTGDEVAEHDEDESPSTFTLTNADTGQLISGCSPREFKTYGSYSGRGDRLQDWANNAEFKRVFRKWVRICTVPYSPSTALKLNLNVSNTGEWDDSYNYFSIRAGMLSGGKALTANQQTAPRVYGSEYMVVFANYNGSDTRLPLTFVPPNYAGQTVSISLFDVGDAKLPGTFELVSDSYNPVSGSATKNCDYTDPSTKLRRKMPNCTLPNVDSSDFNGRTVNIQWHVPSDYICDVTEKTPGYSCTLFVRVKYPPGTPVGDITTWSVGGQKNPVRLVRP